MIHTFSYIELELGCGNRKRNRNAIGIDLLDFPDVDLIGDVSEVLALFPSQSIDSVSSYHFIEHVSDLQKLLSELARVVKSNGKVEFVAPHFSNPYFYSDPTHRNYFGLYTFCYFTTKSPFARQVPTYDHAIDFEVRSVDLIFKSAKPFYIRYVLKRLLGSIFNSSNFMKEIFEENFCYLFPCYEVRYLLTKC
jgi:ubiquinone/menaquinone biosynthesis C-methylase UbiE